VATIIRVDPAGGEPATKVESQRARLRRQIRKTNRMQNLVAQAIREEKKVREGMYPRVRKEVLKRLIDRVTLSTI
jgi:hypothetical protein